MTLETRIAEAAECIRAQWGKAPDCGIILGTGYGAMAERVRGPVIIPYAEIPHFPRSTALAHVGRLVCGELFGASVAVMQGRCHLYEGYSLDEVALPTMTLCALGAKRMIVTNAAGGVNPYYAIGDVMLIDSHINLMWGEPSAMASMRRPEEQSRDGPVRRATAGNPYCRDLLEKVWRESATPAFHAHRGVYVAVTGPSYETRSEYRCFRKIGGDAVGMSTAPEAVAAANEGVPVLGISVITNVARPDSPETVDAEDVVVASHAAANNVLSVVETAIKQ